MPKHLNASTAPVPAEPPVTPIRSYAKANRDLSAKFDSWLEVQHYSIETRRAYRGLTEDLCRFIASRSLLDVQHFDIREYLGYLHKRGLAPSSLARQLSGLKAFFDFLQLGGLVSSVAARMIKTRKVPKRLPRFLSLEEVTRLLEAGETPRDKAILELLYATGCRRAEVCGIRLEDLNFEERSIRVIGKGDKQRIVLFGGPAKEALLAYLGDRRDGFLFQDEWRREWRPATKPPRKSQKVERPLKGSAINRIVKKAALRAGLRGIHPHSLRHTFATHLLNAGANIREVQELLGHASISSTMIYTHVSMVDLSQIHTKFHPRG